MYFNSLFLILGARYIILLVVILLVLIYIKIKFFKIKIHFLDNNSYKGHIKFYDLNGIIHFHSTYSDGSGKIENLIKIANKLKADFLISSDHNTLKPKYDGLEGYYGNLFYFAGEEINTEFGHFLALGIKDEIKRGDYKDVLLNIKKQNGLGIICHPHNWWTPWKNFSVSGFNGIEIINLDSQWRGMNPLYILLVLITYKINSFYSLHFLAHKPKKTLEFWDSVQKHNRLITGIASIDAHSNVKISKNKRVKFPKYEELFSIARTHLLLDEKFSGNIEKDKSLIVKAIKKGSCYFSFDLFGLPSGFYFEAETIGQNNRNENFASGDTINLKKMKDEIQYINFYSGININHKKTNYEIILYKNGKQLYMVKNSALEFKIKISCDNVNFEPVKPTDKLNAEIKNKNDDNYGIKTIKDFINNNKPESSNFYRVEINIIKGYKKITYLYSNNIEIFGE
ncbi:MAG: PHP domain-containing protein [bacterium]